MPEFKYSSLLPFIPSGANYQTARQFFVELGFEEQWEHGGLAKFQSAGTAFFLQNFHDDAFASNLMMNLVVPGLDAWWQWIETKQLQSRFEGVRLKPPTEVPWGREVVIIDLAGVCWHVSEQ